MSDYCPPPFEVRFFVNSEPFLQYVNFTLGLLLAVPLAFILRWR